MLNQLRRLLFLTLSAGAASNACTQCGALEQGDHWILPDCCQAASVSSARAWYKNITTHIQSLLLLRNYLLHHPMSALVMTLTGAAFAESLWRKAEYRGFSMP